jgi:hypothetical protein
MFFVEIEILMNGTEARDMLVKDGGFFSFIIAQRLIQLFNVMIFFFMNLLERFKSL